MSEPTPAHGDEPFEDSEDSSEVWETCDGCLGQCPPAALSGNGHDDLRYCPRCFDRIVNGL